ncbi:hypothetical protein Tco_1547067 [Tanacetum coccineum]
MKCSLNVQFIYSPNQDAYKVINEMSMNKFIEQYGTVKEYFDSFNSLFSKMGFDDSYLVNLFICGLSPDIEKWISLFKPKTLSDAYCLAILQEQTHNFIIKNSNRPLLDSSISKDSKEVVKNEMGLRNFNDSSKEGIKSKENEHVGLGGFDELCEEIVNDSSRIEKDSNCVMDLDNNDKETESRVSAMGYENTIGEQEEIKKMVI